ncbi:hypothetical protein [Lactococcus lactis]|uniref:hypothetical protein n=1 Tax=Lactococcus lactis TaxID=1358 RepID=UPI00288F7F27|nr:hypothetical protein [Lactococcus lactis]MDT2905178.1 hypothetical protein [Lactococcus lactis]MDT2969149.1 hypothetical protein [Lactococcus lactis]
MNSITIEMLKDFIIRLLNMSPLIGDLSTYSNGFTVEIDEDRKLILIIIQTPSAVPLTESLYFDIYQTLNVGLFPAISLIRPSNMKLVARKGADFSEARAFAYPYLNGTPERLHITNFDSFLLHQNQKKVQLMKNYFVDFSKISVIAVQGVVSSGKSTFVNFLMTVFNSFSDCVAIDPKMADLTIMSRKLKIRCLTPVKNGNTNDFLNSVNAELSSAVEKIYERQNILLDSPNAKLKPIYIFIDEIVALKGLATSKPVIQTFDRLINVICCLGRATNLRLCLSSQSYSVADSISSTARSQIGMAVLLGKVSDSTAQFLFDTRVSGIVIPYDGIPGTGIIAVSDGGINETSILPFLTPTYLLN